jgi:hypothetical protein
MIANILLSQPSMLHRKHRMEAENEQAPDSAPISGSVVTEVRANTMRTDDYPFIAHQQPILWQRRMESQKGRIAAAG